MLPRPTEVVSKGLQLYSILLSRLSMGASFSEDDIQQWKTYQDIISASVAQGSLESVSSTAAVTVAKTVCHLLSAKTDLDRTSDDAVCQLVSDMNSIRLQNGSDVDRRRKADVELRDRRVVKRTCRPASTTKYNPTPSPSPPPTHRTSSKPTTTKAPSTQNNPFSKSPVSDPVRLFFLTHLANPYPTPAEKDRLCKVAKITRRKLESDLTNWRRRSDWTDMMNTYCGGDKAAMGRMIGALERGEEEDEELVRRFEGMRAYLEKRDEQAGEWVLQLAEMVEAGRINELQSISNNTDSGIRSAPSRPPYKSKAKPKRKSRARRYSYSDDTSSDPDSESDAEEEDQDEDQDDNDDEHRDEYEVVNTAQIVDVVEVEAEVEGDSDDDAEGESVASSLVEVDHAASLHLCPTSSSRFLESIPARRNYTRTKPRVGPFSSAPLTSDHAGEYPSGWSASTYSTHYSSLSAGPPHYAQHLSATGPRKRHISDSSNASNTRSVSGNSASTDGSTHLATPFASDLYPSLHHNDSRPSLRDSTGRNSKSRVNERLDERDTQASWVEGYAPGQGFHIGSSSSSAYPREYFDLSMAMGMGVPPPLTFQSTEEVGVYDMAPGAWDVGTVGGHGLMPHMSNLGREGSGGFSMPEAYEFTYAEVVTE